MLSISMTVAPSIVRLRQSSSFFSQRPCSGIEIGLKDGTLWVNMASSGSTGNSMNKIERAHQMYREGKYEEALEFYTDALSLAKTKPQKIALHSNRAACFLKLLLFHKAAEECTSVLELDHKHTGALMLRAQTLVTLKEYHSALFDVNRLIELNPSSEVYQNLHARLKTQLSLAPIPESEAELEEDEDGDLSNHDSECNTDDGSRKTVPDIPANPVSSHARSPEKPDGQRAGWQAIPQPKGHSRLDYSRWDRVEEESSEEEEDDDDEESNERNPQYRFKVKTIGVRAVK